MDSRVAKIKETAIKTAVILALAGILALGTYGSIQAIRALPDIVGGLVGAVGSLFSENISQKDAGTGVANTSETSTNGTTGSETVHTTPTTPVTPGSKTEGTFPLGGSAVAPSDPNGFVDLSVRITAYGILRGAHNEFVATSSVQLFERGAVKFEVVNIGTKTSPAWGFTAVLPTNPWHIFQSPSQQALGPGERIEFTLGFDRVANKNPGEITINIDPTGGIKEKTKDNNIARGAITVVTQ